MKIKITKYLYFKNIKNSHYLVDLRKNIIYEIDRKRYQNIETGKLHSVDMEFLSSNNLLVENNIEEYHVELSRFNTMISDSKRLDLVILVTNDCNFGCVYCYENYSKFKLNDYNINDIINFINNMLETEKYNSVFINWFGGEPLLELNNIEKFSNLVKILCHEKGVPYISSITTNGYSLNLDNFKKLLGLNVRYFQVTIDGDEESHNELRPLKSGYGSFDKIMKNLISIKNERLKNFFSINIRCNITKNTINNYYKLEEILRKNFLDDNRFKLTPFLVSDFGGNLVKKIENELMDNYDMINVNGIANYNNIFDTPVQEEICYVWKNGGFTIVPDRGVFKCSHFVEECGDYNKNYLFNFDNIDYKRIKTVQDMIIKNNHAEKCVECKYMPFCYINTCPIKQSYKLKENCKITIKSMLDFEIEKKLGSAINGKV